MGVGSGHLRVSDLAFQVFGRALHPDWFVVRAHRRITRTGWEADVRIVDGGHVIVWGSGDARLTEILLPADAYLPDAGLLYQAPVRHERSVELRPGTRVEYQSCFEVERLDEALFAHVAEEIQVEPLGGGLFHGSAPSSRLAQSSLSRIQIQGRSKGLSIQAFHTFPDERAVVRTQSLFEVVESRPR